MTPELTVHNVELALFALVAAFVIGGWIFRSMRGERLGTLKVPGRFGLDMSFMSATGPAMHVRLTVVREDGPSPKVQVRVVAAMSMDLEQLEPADAMTLAHLLDTASSRLRAP